MQHQHYDFMNQLTINSNVNQIEKRTPYQIKSLNKGAIDNYAADPNLSIQSIDSIINPKRDNIRIKSREQINSS